MPNISFRNIKKVYPNGTYSLNGVSFDINKGDFVCVIGESGGGKTTLLRLIAGLETATCGEIFFNDEISNYLEVAKRDVAFVFQEYALYPNKTVFENIISSLSKSKMSYEEKFTKTIDIIEQMGLEIISGEVPKHLSFGQCQKVALARALVRKPKIMLFDEPLSNIDNEAKEEYKLLILEAKRILPNSTFVYVTHNINDALQLSNKIMVIDQGDILQYDNTNVIYNYPLNKKICD
jgi:multiple sugar transport system ATP-binding protein